MVQNADRTWLTYEINSLSILSIVLGFSLDDHSVVYTLMCCHLHNNNCIQVNKQYLVTDEVSQQDSL